MIHGCVRAAARLRASSVLKQSLSRDVCTPETCLRAPGRPRKDGRERPRSAVVQQHGLDGGFGVFFFVLFFGRGEG